MHRQTIESDVVLVAALKSNKTIIGENVSQEYARSIKSLHCAIIDFTGNANLDLNVECASHLFDLRRGSRRIVQAI